MENFYSEIVRRVAKTMIETCKEAVEAEYEHDPDVEKEYQKPKADFIRDGAETMAMGLTQEQSFWNSVHDDILARSSPKTEVVEIQIHDVGGEG